jgi:hypothetical protein
VEAMEEETAPEETASIENTHFPIDWVTGMIASLSGSCRQLSLCALDLQSLGLSKKHDIEAAIDRVNDIGDIICQMIKLLEKLIYCWIRKNISVLECDCLKIDENRTKNQC